MYTRSNQVIDGVRLIGFAHGYFYFVEDQSAVGALIINGRISVQSCKQISDTDTFENVFTLQEVTQLASSLQDYLNILLLTPQCNQLKKLIIVDSAVRHSGVCLLTAKVVPLSQNTPEYVWIEIARSKITVKDYYDTYPCKSNSSR